MVIFVDLFTAIRETIIKITLTPFKEKDKKGMKIPEKTLSQKESPLTH